jgi:hypothetical protein
MELKTKYQYTYFVYPFTVNKDRYESFISGMIIDKNWQIKIFNKSEDVEIDSHFLMSAKNLLFPTINWDQTSIEKFNKKNSKTKAKTLSDLKSCMFEYKIDGNAKGKMEQENSIFFEISKIKLMCFKEGICFLILKVEIDEKEYINFREVLNLNYKFRNITPEYMRLKDYDHIKIQSSRFDTAEDIRQFIKRTCIGYEDISSEDIYSNRLFVYSYVCFDESEWNMHNEFKRIEDEFLKFQYVLPGDYSSEFNQSNKLEHTYSRWKYSIYGFSKMSGVVFSSAEDHFNFTKLPFYFENVYFYIMLYAFYQRIRYMLFLKEIEKTKNKRILKSKLIELINNNNYGQISNSEHGMNLWKNWQESFELKEISDEIQKRFNIL